MTGRDPSRGPRAARLIGGGLIALLWSTAAYLLAYYAVLLYFGPERLQSMLGYSLYNALVAMGGFQLLLWAGVLAVVWGVPLALASAALAGLMRLTRPSGSAGLRWRAAGLGGLLLTASLQLVPRWRAFTVRSNANRLRKTFVVPAKSLPSSGVVGGGDPVTF